MELKSGTKMSRIGRFACSPQSRNSNAKTLLLSVLENERTRCPFEAQNSLSRSKAGLAWNQRAGLLFAGVSLGSILLLSRPWGSPSPTA